MAIPEFSATTGALPLGRHHCSLTEAKAHLVDHPQFTGSVSRPQIWQHWLIAKDTLKAVVPIHAAWIGGSFTTTKAEPDDMDVVFVINANAASTLAGASRDLVWRFSRGSQFHKPARRLDTFILEWTPIAEPGALRQVEDESYFAWRGHWDDFWQRQRSGSKIDPVVPADAIPRRGYLEVRFGGYTT